MKRILAIAVIFCWSVASYAQYIETSINGFNDGDTVCKGQGYITLTAKGVATGTFSGPNILTTGTNGWLYGTIHSSPGPDSIKYSYVDTVKFSQVQGGYSFVIAIDQNGGLWGWGSGPYFGAGNSTNQPFPFQIGTDTDWDQIAVYFNHILALKEDGTLWAWGYNNYGQLGDNTLTNRISPTQIGTDTNWVSIAAGRQTSFAIKSDGSLWSWGAGNPYLLGSSGLPRNYRVPVKIGTDTNWVSVSSGWRHSVALKSDGTMWSWGYNYQGSLGTGNTAHQLTPVQIGSDTNWSKIAVGEFHSHAIKKDGTFWSWGYNAAGNLGNGATTPSYVPIKIGNDTNWQTIEAGPLAVLATKKDKSLWAWGLNNAGQIGDGTTTHRFVPQNVGIGIGWSSAVSNGIYNSFAIDTIGQLYSWGNAGSNMLARYGSTNILPGKVIQTKSSSIVVNLTVAAPTSSSQTVTSCDSYTWAANGKSYTASGTYRDTIANAMGCDSAMTLNLTINKSSSTSLTRTRCDSYTWPTTGQTYTTSGTYRDTLTNAVGCDSIVTLSLTLNYSNTGSETVTTCDRFVWATSGKVYTTSGAYKDTLTNVDGCDSVITLNLTIKNSTAGSETVTTCDSYTWATTGQTYTVSGAYKDTLTNAVGCDSIITLNLTINYSNTGGETVTSCDSYMWPTSGQTYTSSGVYRETLTNASGCDSVVTLLLTINNSNTGSETITRCDSYTWPASGQTYTTSGTYTKTLTNASGCDSVVTLNLTINYSNTGSETITSCDSYTWRTSGQTYTTSGRYTETLTNASGCDSVVTLNLTINYSNTGSETITSCDSYTWPTSGQTYTTSGTYTETLTNASGCDSVVTLNLTINNSSIGSETITSCDSYTWPTTGQTYTVSGTYLDTLVNAVGCDSVVTLNLTINYSASNLETITSCDSYTWPTTGQTYTASGSYVDTLSTVDGCDSIVMLDLTIHYSDSSRDTVTACFEYKWLANDSVYTESGIYFDTIQTVAGCDSMVALYLTIDTVDVSVTSQSPTLTANATQAEYQWLFCSSGFPILGENEASFTAVANGDYSVEVTQKGCVDTSDCYTIGNVLIEGSDEESWAARIYPNPTNGEVNIAFDKALEHATIVVYSATGQEVLRKEIENSNQTTTALTGDAGIYHVVVVSERGEQQHFRVVKR